jgi:hypothetical protein
LRRTEAARRSVGGRSSIVAPVLIAEDLLLLLTDDRTGKLVVLSSQVDVALGGALLLELSLEHRVDVAGGSEAVKAGRLIVKNDDATGDELLDEALARVSAKQGKRPKDVVRALGKGVRARLHDRLVQAGILREELGKVLGVLPKHRWPATDLAHEDAVRAPLEDALRAGATDDARVAALVSLLHALRAVHKVVDPSALGLTKKKIEKNAAAIAEGDWASEAVRRAIAEMLAAAAAGASAAASG